MCRGHSHIHTHVLVEKLVERQIEDTMLWRVHFVIGRGLVSFQIAETDRQTYTQTDKQTDRWTNRCAHKQTVHALTV